jgi:iron complex outermembrane recepter protein
MLKKLFLPAALLAQMAAYGQLNGLVQDESNKPIASATISLYRAVDSSLIKSVPSQKDGTYSVPVTEQGQYFVKVTNTGYREQIRSFSYLGKPVALSIGLVPKEGALENVIIKAQKPPIEMKADKMIFNVEANAAATGLDGMELLRQAPGVLVDHEDNITLSGKSGVQVFIDGKPSPLTGKDLTSYLRSVRSNSIDAIEIINNPSAKYDAAGTGGIINIKLKKNSSFGTNGSVNTDYQQGIFYPKFNNGFSINTRNKNINLFGNLNYTNATNVFDLDIYRDVMDSLFDTYSSSVTRVRTVNFKTGLDLFLNKRSTLGFLAAGNLSNDNNRLNSITYIKDKNSFKTDRLLRSNNTTAAEKDNVNFNINYLYQHENGRSLTVDADYGRFKAYSENFQPNRFYDSTGANLISEKNFMLVTPTQIDIYSLKSDYEQNLAGGKLGVGFKSTSIRSDNVFRSFFNNDNKLSYDSTLSNNFLYRENINAVYSTFNRSFKSIQLLFGLRLEQTISKGTSTGFHKNTSNQFADYKENFSRNLLNLFPSFSLSFTKNPKSQWTVSYSRRINRPSYNDMNPFERRQSEYTGFKGNPNLRPELAHSFGLSHVFKNKLVTIAGFTQTENVIASISDTLNGTRSFYFPKNLASQQNFNINSNYSYSKKAFSFTTGFTAAYIHNKADFGAGRTIDLRVKSFTTYIQPNVKPGKGWSFMTRAWYNSPQIFRGTMLMQQQFSMNIGMQKLLFNDAATLRVNFNDVFHSLRFVGTSDFAGQYLLANAYFEQRRLIVSMNYRFGSSQVKANRQRKTGIDEEAQRTKE